MTWLERYTTIETVCKDADKTDDANLVFVLAEAIDIIWDAMTEEEKRKANGGEE